MYKNYSHSVADLGLWANLIQETSLGLPVVVHNPSATISTATLASFLIGQGNYTYFGSSSGWTDDTWSWHPEYVAMFLFLPLV